MQPDDEVGPRASVNGHPPQRRETRALCRVGRKGCSGDPPARLEATRCQRPQLDFPDACTTRCDTIPDLVDGNDQHDAGPRPSGDEAALAVSRHAAEPGHDRGTDAAPRGPELDQLERAVRVAISRKDRPFVIIDGVGDVDGGACVGEEWPGERVVGGAQVERGVSRVERDVGALYAASTLQIQSPAAPPERDEQRARVRARAGGAPRRSSQNAFVVRELVDTRTSGELAAVNDRFATRHDRKL